MNTKFLCFCTQWSPLYEIGLCTKWSLYEATPVFFVRSGLLCTKWSLYEMVFVRNDCQLNLVVKQLEIFWKCIIILLSHLSNHLLISIFWWSESLDRFQPKFAHSFNSNTCIYISWIWYIYIWIRIFWMWFNFLKKS